LNSLTIRGGCISEDAVLIISHTGSTAYARESLAVVRRAGAVAVTVTGLESSFGEDGQRLLTTPPETSATYTVSYLGALTALAMTAGYVGEAHGRAISKWIDILTRVPGAIADILAAESELFPAAQDLATWGRLVLVDAGPNAATAYECALKVKE
jgi:glutamine---fructose-6-phosphate transaminase (isomerizing)